MMFSSFLLKGKTPVRTLAVTGMIVLLAANILEMNGTVLFRINWHDMISVNRFNLLFNSTAIFSILLYFLLSARDIEKVGNYFSDYLALIFFITCGIILVTTFQSLLILFLGIEIISIPLYILTGADKRNLKSNEASLKYFLLGSFSTGVMLMGIAFLYGVTGSFAPQVQLGPDQQPNALMMGGLLLLLFSMSFKVSLAPFHFWTPDVYDGAPTVFTSFMATIVKAAIFIGFIRLFGDGYGVLQPKWQFFVMIITVATLLIGNITAVFQQSVKRMLAYSSIAQAGFMMFALFAMNTEAVEGLLLYTVAYSLATIGIFAVLIKMPDYTFNGFNGLAKHQPLLAATTTIFLLSLAGIPLTAGFMSKFYMLKALMTAGHSLWLVIFAVLMAAVSVYYYFRVIQAMYFREGADPGIRVSPAFRWTLVFIAILVIALGVFPNLLLFWFYF